MTFVAVYVKEPDGVFTAFAEGVPGADARGRTQEEARRNLRDAVARIWMDRRRDIGRAAAGKEVVCETLEEEGLVAVPPLDAWIGQAEHEAGMSIPAEEVFARLREGART